MQSQPREMLFLYYGTIILWIGVVVGVWVLGRRWEPLSHFRERMLGQWRPALVITVIYSASVLLSGRGFNPYVLAIFCQALIGLAIAKGIPAFDAAPVIDSFLRRHGLSKAFFRCALAGLLAGLIGIVVGIVAMEIPRQLFHEVVPRDDIMQEFPASKFQAFFLFLAGGGLAEELVHRLVLLSLIWSLTKRPGLAILVSAVVHSAYHFTPFNLLYLHFLQFPMTQFVSGVAMGILWGYVLVKYGFETAALGHTLSDWLPLWFFV